MQGGLVMAKSGRLELGDNIYGVYIQPVRRIWPAKKSKSAKKRQIRAITPFKVIQGHRGWYQSKARMQLPISD